MNIDNFQEQLRCSILKNCKKNVLMRKRENEAGGGYFMLFRSLKDGDGFLENIAYNFIDFPDRLLGRMLL